MNSNPKPCERKTSVKIRKHGDKRRKKRPRRLRKKRSVAQKEILRIEKRNGFKWLLLAYPFPRLLRRNCRSKITLHDKGILLYEYEHGGERSASMEGAALAAAVR
jgi:hypothetical protein